MRKRFKMSKKASRHSFRKGASHINKRNVPRSAPMRGGIRL